MSNFDAKKVKNEIVLWIRDWFEKNGKNCRCVLGVSGGKDSSVVAALAVEALGKDRVLGVLMPQGIQSDIDYSYMLCNFLEIQTIIVPVGGIVNSVTYEIETSMDKKMSTQAITNLPPRIRMAVLYAVSQSVNGRVANTCNLSEDWIGYATRYGDSAGDFSPLSNLTVTEVRAIGHELGLPSVLVDKVPSDGLCGKSDEDNLGFTYDVLDKYIRTGEIEDSTIKEKIDALHEKNLFKLQPMPSFSYDGSHTDTSKKTKLMKKFKVTQDADYVVGHLRYGHREGIIEAESIEDALYKLQNKGYTDYLDFKVDSCEVEDADFDDMPFEIEEVID